MKAEEKSVNFQLCPGVHQGKESKRKRITSKHPYNPVFRTSMSSISPFLPRASICFVNPDREKSPRGKLSLRPSDEIRDVFLRSSFKISIPTGLFDHLHSAAKTGSSPATATRSISSFPFHHRPAFVFFRVVYFKVD